MPAAAPDDWIKSVSADNLRLHSVDIGAGETASQAVMRLAEETGVDLAMVGRCLALLRLGHCMLSGGAPLAMLSYSPRRGVYRASFDGDCPADLSALTLPSAGVWLTLLSGELGPLPETDEHWLIAKFTPGGVVAANPYVNRLAAGHAGVPDASQAWPPSLERDGYERLVGRAFWCCAAHCLR